MLSRYRSMASRLILTLVFSVSASARGADLICFEGVGEASGYYFVQFNVEQSLLAKKCDDTFQKWTPSLLEVSGHASAYNAQQSSGFPDAATKLARRLGVSNEALFQFVMQKAAPLIPASVPLEQCEWLAKRLGVRLSSPSDMIEFAVSGAAAEKEAGHLCK